MITEVQQKPGSWQLNLRPEAPINTRLAPQFMGHLVVTPVRCADPRVTRASLLARSIYTGVIRRRSAEMLQFGGAHILIWAGDEQNKGKLVTSFGASTDWATWMTAFSGGSFQGLTVNPVTSNPGGTVSPGTGTPRQLMETMAKQLGAEYRLRHDGTFVHGATGTGVFQIYPRVIIFDREGGRDANYVGLRADSFTVTEDTDSSVATIYAYSPTANNTYTPGAPVYKDFTGTTNWAMQRALSLSVGTAGDCLAAATGEANAYAYPKKQVSVDVREYAPTRYAVPGDYVFLWSFQNRLWDLNHEVTFRGSTFAPLAAQMTEVTWPILQGMGVYCISSDGTNTVTDLTDYVQWETGQSCRITVGSIPRPLGPVFAKDQQTIF